MNWVTKSVPSHPAEEYLDPLKLPTALEVPESKGKVILSIIEIYVATNPPMLYP